jgi:hypothetical protein
MAVASGIPDACPAGMTMGTVARVRAAAQTRGSPAPTA